MIALPMDAVLLLIDVQQAFDHPAWGARNNPGAEAQIAALLAAWREHAMPVYHVHHLSKRPSSHFYPGKPGVAVKDEAMPVPGEPVLVKDVNSAFIGTELETRLRANGATTLVIAGLTTDHCVSTSARMAGNLGFTTYVVSDATATFERVGPDGRHWSAEVMHDTALASINREFASVVSAAEVLHSIAGSSRLACAGVRQIHNEVAENANV